MDLRIENNTHECQDCGMKFYNAAEMVNHTKKFCTLAGLDSLQGLAQYEVGKTLNRNNKNNGAYSLGSMKYQPQTFTASQIANDAKNIASHREKVQNIRPYSNNISMQPPENQNYQQYQQKNATRLNGDNYDYGQKNSIAKHGSRIMGMSDISIKPLNQFGVEYQKSSSNINQKDNNYHSPPSQIPHFVRRPPATILGKSNTSMGNMTRQEKRMYASDKLVQLDNIAEMYDKSGGANIQFRKNIDKMRKFYRKMIEDEGTIKNFPSQYVQSRVQTPINKLRNLDIQTESARNQEVHYDSLDQQINKGLGKSNKKQSTVQIPKKINKNKGKKENAHTFNNQFNQSPYGMMPYMPYQQQPQIIMLPPSYQQASPSYNQNNNITEQIKYFQRMMDMKNRENKELMSMLINSKKQKNPKKFRQSALSTSSIGPVDYRNQEKFYMETQMNPNLSPDQKILISLQRQELDQLRLLSTLPQHLQQIKMQSVLKIIQARTQLEKQILEQKIIKLEQQQKNQLHEEHRKLQNDGWVVDQRKRMIGNQMKDYMNNFQNKLNNVQEDEQDGEENGDYQGQYYEDDNQQN